MSLFYFGFSVPESEVDILYQDSRPAVQTVNFSNKLKRVLLSIDPDLINFYAYPVQNYPKNDSFLISGSFSGREVRLAFINYLFLKHLTRFFYMIISFLRIGKRPSCVVVHGLHSPYLLAALVLKIFGSKIFVVITDPPGVVLNDDSILVKYLKLVDRSFIFFILKFFDGAVILSDHIKDYVPNIKTITINTIIDNAEDLKFDFDRSFFDDKFRLVYGGSLDKIYGVENIIRLAKILDGSKFRIDVYGSGQEEDALIKASSEYDVLNYYGFLPYEEFKSRLVSYDLLINLRVVDCEISKHSFPSKLSEAVMSGVSVLTTPVSSLPSWSDCPFYVSKSDSIDDILYELNLFCSLSRHERRANLRNSREKLIEQFSIENVANKIAIFLKG